MCAWRSEVPGDDRGEFVRVAEGGKVPAGHDNRIDTEPLACDALLKREREEPVLTAGDDVDRNRGPRVEVAAVIESLVQLGSGMGLQIRQQFGRDIVQKVGGQIELNAVTRRSRLPQSWPALIPRSSTIRPVSRRAAGPSR